jgi:hypothetical protein
MFARADFPIEDNVTRSKVGQSSNSSGKGRGYGQASSGNFPILYANHDQPSGVNAPSSMGLVGTDPIVELGSTMVETQSDANVADGRPHPDPPPQAGEGCH